MKAEAAGISRGKLIRAKSAIEHGRQVGKVGRPSHSLDESRLISWLERQIAIDLPPTQDEVIAKAIELSCNTEWVPDRYWVYRFFKKHPEYSYRKAQDLPSHRKSSEGYHKIKNWFDGWKSIVQGFNPDRIVAVDECGTFICYGNNLKVYCK